jgi:hypothetical protein
VPAPDSNSPTRIPFPPLAGCVKITARGSYYAGRRGSFATGGGTGRRRGGKGGRLVLHADDLAYLSTGCGFVRGGSLQKAAPAPMVRLRCLTKRYFHNFSDNFITLFDFLTRQNKPLY